MKVILNIPDTFEVWGKEVSIVDEIRDTARQELKTLVRQSVRNAYQEKEKTITRAIAHRIALMDFTKGLDTPL